MRIRPDNQLASRHQALLRQQGVLHAHATHVIVMRNFMLSGKLSALFALLSRLNILVGSKMVHHQSNFVLIKNCVKTGLFKLVNRHRRGNVIAQAQIQIRHNQLAWLNAFHTGVRGQDFLAHSHSHYFSSYSKSVPISHSAN